MLEIARGKHTFSIRESSKIAAIDYYKKQDNQYKVELIENLEDGTITFCDHDNFTDLCRGGHIPHTGIVKAIKLTKLHQIYQINKL